MNGKFFNLPGAETAYATVNVDPTTGLPATSGGGGIVEGKPSAFWPSYGAPTETGAQEASIDSGGAVVSRSAVLTDEGTFRVNFANASLAVAIGNVTVAGKIVTGTGFATGAANSRDYFKVTADADTAYVQIDSIDSDTQMTLLADYVGTASGAAVRSLMAPIAGAGGSQSVANGACTLVSGTTSGGGMKLARRVDYGPLVFRSRQSISQRIANQITRVGLSDSSPLGRYFARFRFEGTVNTVVVCESARNPTQAPSVAETESTTITLPNGLTSAALLDMRVEMLTEFVRFYIANILVAEHGRAMPSSFDVMEADVSILNTGVAGSSTNVVVDFVTTKNHNKLEIGVMSDAEKIVASSAPLVSYPYSQAGVIAINTDILVIPCSQLRTVNLQALSIGTTGRLDFFLTNDLTAIGTPVAAYPVGGAAAVVNSTAAGMWNIPTNGAAFLRVRMGVATTAATTAVVATGSQSPHPIVLPTTQPVSGSLTSAGTVTNTPVTPTTTFVNSLATTNALNIKNTAGTLWSAVISNVAVSTRYVKFFNLTTVPVPGTNAPVFTVAVPPNGTVTLDGGSNGIRFGTGIGQAITANAADLDATAVALGDVKIAWSFT